MNKRYASRWRQEDQEAQKTPPMAVQNSRPAWPTDCLKNKLITQK